MHRGDRREISAEQKVSPTDQHENHYHINHHHYHCNHRHYHRHHHHMVISLLKAQSKEVAPTNTSSACMQHDHCHQDAFDAWIVPMQWDDNIPLWELKMLRLSVCNLIRRFFIHTKKRQRLVILSWRLVGEFSNCQARSLPSFRAGKKGSSQC